MEAKCCNDRKFEEGFFVIVLEKTLKNIELIVNLWSMRVNEKIRKMTFRSHFFFKILVLETERTLLLNCKILQNFSEGKKSQLIYFVAHMNFPKNAWKLHFTGHKTVHNHGCFFQIDHTIPHLYFLFFRETKEKMLLIVLFRDLAVTKMLHRKEIQSIFGYVYLHESRGHQLVKLRKKIKSLNISFISKNFSYLLVFSPGFQHTLSYWR